jgi:hypothetical protein
LTRRAGSVDRAWHLNVLITSVGILAALAGGLPARLPGSCLFRWATGIACPFCGVTRSVAFALQGHLTEAWRMHPAGLLVAAVLVAQIPIRLVALSRQCSGDGRRPAAWVNAVVVGACLVVFALRAAHP